LAEGVRRLRGMDGWRRPWLHAYTTVAELGVALISQNFLKERFMVCTALSASPSACGWLGAVFLWSVMPNHRYWWITISDTQAILELVSMWRWFHL